MKNSATHKFSFLNVVDHNQYILEHIDFNMPLYWIYLIHEEKEKAINYNAVKFKTYLRSAFENS